MDEGNLGFIELTCILKTSDQKRRGIQLGGHLKKEEEGQEREQGMHEREGILQQLVLQDDAHPTLSFPFQLLSFTWATGKVILKTK